MIALSFWIMLVTTFDGQNKVINVVYPTEQQCVTQVDDMAKFFHDVAKELRCIQINTAITEG